MAPRQKIRELLDREQTTVMPGCLDPLTALILEDIGFEAVYVGGFAIGAQTAITEPLLSLTEMADAAGRVAQTVQVPVLCDAGAGFGQAIHVARTIQEFERAGLAGVHIEDQYYPKQMHYHTLPAPTEDMIPIGEMCAKIEAAVNARADPNFLIIGRTDAVASRGGGMEEAVRRANTYSEAGADAIMAFPETAQQIEELPRRVRAPLVYVVTEGRHRPRPPVDELKRLGYRFVVYSSAVVMAVGRGVREVFTRLYQTGQTALDVAEMAEMRKYVNRLLKVPERIEMERKSARLSGTGGGG